MGQILSNLSAICSCGEPECQIRAYVQYVGPDPILYINDGPHICNIVLARGSIEVLMEQLQIVQENLKDKEPSHAQIVTGD